MPHLHPPSLTNKAGYVPRVRRSGHPPYYRSRPQSNMIQHLRICRRNGFPRKQILHRPRVMWHSSFTYQTGRRLELRKLGARQTWKRERVHYWLQRWRPRKLYSQELHNWRRTFWYLYIGRVLGVLGCWRLNMGQAWWPSTWTWLRWTSTPSTWT